MHHTDLEQNEQQLILKQLLCNLAKSLYMLLLMLLHWFRCRKKKTPLPLFVIAHTNTQSPLEHCSEEMLENAPAVQSRSLPFYFHHSDRAMCLISVIVLLVFL